MCYCFMVFLLLFVSTIGDVIITIKSGDQDTLHLQLVEGKEVDDREHQVKKNKTMEVKEFYETLDTRKKYVTQFNPSMEFGRIKHRKNQDKKQESERDHKPRFSSEKFKPLRMRIRSRPRKTSRPKRKYNFSKPENRTPYLSIWNFWLPVKRIFQI